MTDTLAALAARVDQLETQVFCSPEPGVFGGLVVDIKSDQGAGEGAVEFAELSAHMVLAVIVVASHFAGITDRLTITSGSDGNHSPKSKHYRGEGLDFRTRTLDPAEAVIVANKIRKALAHQYDVVLKTNPRNLHLHVEYDPWAPGRAPDDEPLYV